MRIPVGIGSIFVVIWQSFAYKMLCRKRYTIGDSDSGRYTPPFFCRKKPILDFAMSQGCGVPFATRIFTEGRSVMAAKKFGYVRVSTREQNPERQIHILRDEEGIDERDIYVEKESGRQFERPVYRSLVDNILREGDLLVVTELKRFGRNYGEIYKEWFHITKEIGADIKVTSMPILDTTQSKELVGQLITDVVLAVFAYVADEDWMERHELQRQGIEVAKADGKHLGRPRVEFPENWEDCYERWKSGVISAKEAMTLTGLKKDSFYRLVKKYEAEFKNTQEERA